MGLAHTWLSPGEGAVTIKQQGKAGVLTPTPLLESQEEAVLISQGFRLKFDIQ